MKNCLLPFLMLYCFSFTRAQTVARDFVRPQQFQKRTVVYLSLRVNILNVLTDLRGELGMTILFITHDIGQACYLADKVLVMEHGLMVEQGKTDDVIFNPQHEYTKRLLADVPKLHEAIQLEELHETVEPR